MTTEQYEMQELELLAPNLYQHIQDCLPGFIEGLWDTDVVYLTVGDGEFKVSWEQRGNMVDVHFDPNTDSGWIRFEDAPSKVSEEVKLLV